MISMCLYEYWLFPTSDMDYTAYAGNEMLNPQNATSLSNFHDRLDSQEARILSSTRKEEGVGANLEPGDRLTSWIPGSSSSTLENQLDYIRSMRRRLQNESDLWDSYKNGTPAPGFWESKHKLGWIDNAVRDNPVKTGLGLAATAGLGYAGINALMKNRKEKQEQQNNGFQNRFANNGNY